MTDIEGITKKLLLQQCSEEKIRERLLEEYQTYKSIPDELLIKMAKAVIDECKKSLATIAQPKSDLIHKLLDIPSSLITMGEHGVGCRGQGDFFVHSLLSKLSATSIKPMVSPEAMDDTGAINVNDFVDFPPKVILSKMEGMHSRLSDYPFIAGFHVTRAALRDIYVKGGIPVSLMVDVHLADDGDIGKLFDFQAGIATVAELSQVPITAGSTLRIGGDMVIGDRITGGIAAIGISRYSFFRTRIQPGDAIIMTEGAGGGTIVTTAIYANRPETIKETLNLKFVQAAKTLFTHSDLCDHIHTMADITNGGLRNDLHEINHTSKTGVRITLDSVRSLVNPRVLDLLDQERVDYLGVSLDALLIYCDPSIVSEIITLLAAQGIKSAQIGKVIPESKVIFIDQLQEEIVEQRFRESAYTKIKKVIDQQEIVAVNIREQKILEAFQRARQKKEDFISYIQKNTKTDGK